jgi:hypothetical protein
MRKNNIRKENKWENEINENWPSFGHLAEKNLFFFKESFSALCYFIVDVHAMSWKAMCHQDLEAGR